MKSEFYITRQGKQHVLFAGLLDLAHNHGLKSIETELIDYQVDAEGEPRYAITKATVTMEDGRIFEGIGDATRKNVGKNIAPHLVRMSETRAKARALRDCVPLDAEILTRDGFKQYSELRIGEEVLAYDVSTDFCWWVPLRGVNIYETSPLLKLRNRNFALRCTPNHKWAVRSSKGKRALKRTCDLTSDSSLIMSALAESGEHPLGARDAAILGWLCTDGGIYERPNGTIQGKIAQSREEHLQEIRELLADDLTNVYYPKAGKGTFATTKQAHVFNVRASYVRCLKGIVGRIWTDLPRLATRLSSEARAAMLEAMLKADGSQNTNGTWTFGKDSRPAVMETWQILTTLEGMPLGRMQMYHGGKHTRQYTRKNRLANYRFLAVEEEQAAPAWCPTTPLGTWVMRQNGHIIITGNSVNIGVAALEELGEDTEPDVQLSPKAEVKPLREVPKEAPEKPQVVDEGKHNLHKQLLERVEDLLNEFPEGYFEDIEEKRAFARRGIREAQVAIDRLQTLLEYEEGSVPATKAPSGYAHDEQVELLTKYADKLYSDRSKVLDGHEWLLQQRKVHTFHALTKQEAKDWIDEMKEELRAKEEVKA